MAAQGLDPERRQAVADLVPGDQIPGRRVGPAEADGQRQQRRAAQPRQAEGAAPSPATTPGPARSRRTASAITQGSRRNVVRAGSQRSTAANRTRPAVAAAQNAVSASGGQAGGRAAARPSCRGSPSCRSASRRRRSRARSRRTARTVVDRGPGLRGGAGAPPAAAAARCRRGAPASSDADGERQPPPGAEPDEHRDQQRRQRRAQPEQGVERQDRDVRPARETAPPPACSGPAPSARSRCPGSAVATSSSPIRDGCVPVITNWLRDQQRHRRQVGGEAREEDALVRPSARTSRPPSSDAGDRDDRLRQRTSRRTRPLVSP